MGAMKPETKARVEAERKARLEAHIKKTCENFPPLTPEQRDRLALLLRPKGEPPLDPMGGDVLNEMMEAE